MHSNDKNESFAKIKILEKSVISLEECVNEPIGEKRFIIDASIQRFEYTFELLWKTLKVVLLEKYGIDAKSPKITLQEAFQQDLIDDEDVWIAMLNDRNQTSYTYDEKVADYIYSHISEKFFPILKKTMLHLKEKFGSSLPE